MTSITRRQLAKLLFASPVALLTGYGCTQQDINQGLQNAQQTAVAAAKQTAEAELRNRIPKLPDPPKLPKLPSLGWTFSDLPVADSQWRNGFGAAGFAASEYEKLKKDKTYPFPYANTSGLHGGLDFGYLPKTGPKPDVHARVEGKIIGIAKTAKNTSGVFLNDALPNIIVQVGNYYVLYGHVDSDPNNPDIKVDGNVNTETKLGTIFDQDARRNTHLHLSIRIKDRSYNPIYFFDKTLAEKITWGDFAPSETAWSMRSFLYRSIDVANYWVDPNDPDLGIER